MLYNGCMTSKTCMNNKPMKNSRVVSKDDLKPLLFPYKKSQLLFPFSTKEPWYSFPWSRKRNKHYCVSSPKTDPLSFLAPFFLSCLPFLSLFLLHQIPPEPNKLSKPFKLSFRSFVLTTPLPTFCPNASRLFIARMVEGSPRERRCSVFWLWVIDGLDACGGSRHAGRAWQE